MVQTIQAKNLTLYEVERKFGLILVQDEQFFREWLDDLPELTDGEQQRLDRVKAQYLYLAKRPLLEVIVKMVVLSPLLDLAGFYDPPFYITAEEEVRISEEVEGEIIKGLIDVLVLYGNFWITFIESKRPQLDVMQGLPQALTYMMDNPHPEKAAFGLITNGREVIFIKLTKQDTPRYALSKAFSILNPGNDLYDVLRGLKRIGEIISF